MNEREPILALSRDQTVMLKGCAIWLVLLGHLWALPFGGALGVAIFLSLSGYGLNLSLEAEGLRGYWQKRFRKVWLPYFFVGVFDVLVLKASGARAILCTVLGLDFGCIADSTMWYISYILLWYLVFYLAALVTRRLHRRSVREGLKLALLLLAALGFRALFSLGVWSAASAAGSYGLAFPLGVALTWLGRLRLSAKQRITLWLAVLFFSSAYLLRFYPFAWQSPLLTSAALAQALALLQLIALPRRLQRGLLWFGRYSYPIYLFEGLILPVRDAWFGWTGLTILVMLGFIGCSALMGAVYWTCYRKLEAAFLPGNAAERVR